MAHEHHPAIVRPGHAPSAGGNRVGAEFHQGHGVGHSRDLPDGCGGAKVTSNRMEASPGDDPATLHGRQLNIVFGGLMLVMLIASLDSTVVSTALPTIVGDLGGLNHISWVVTAYLLAQTVVTPLYGKLGDLYGRKIVLQTGIVLFVVGSALCGLSKNMPELIAFRAFQGLGGGGLIVSAQAAVGDVVSPPAGELPRPLRRRLRIGIRRRAAAGWHHHHQSVVAVDLLHQPPLGAISWWCSAPGSRNGNGASTTGSTTSGQPAGHRVGALVLMVSLGGTTYPWSSAEIIGLGAAAAW